MTYNELKVFTINLIKEELNIAFEMPVITNYYHDDTWFRLFFSFTEIDYIIDIEVDKNINCSNLMVFGPLDYGPFNLHPKNIKKAIKFIKQKIQTEFRIIYFEDSVQLGRMIIDSSTDFSEQDINLWLNKHFVNGSFENISNDLHPKGYTRINKITTQFTFQGPIRTYVKKGLRFILQE